jgi:hypothetical protein
LIRYPSMLPITIVHLGRDLTSKTLSYVGRRWRIEVTLFGSPKNEKSQVIFFRSIRGEKGFHPC